MADNGRGNSIPQGNSEEMSGHGQEDESAGYAFYLSDEQERSDLSSYQKMDLFFKKSARFMGPSESLPPEEQLPRPPSPTGTEYTSVSRRPNSGFVYAQQNQFG